MGQKREGGGIVSSANASAKLHGQLTGTQQDDISIEPQPQNDTGEQELGVVVGARSQSGGSLMPEGGIRH
ncbi:hypothetical protein ACLKA7_013937 [Drosophila subpalustris]